MSETGRQSRLARATLVAVVAVAACLGVTVVSFERFIADEDAALRELSDATAIHRLLDRTLQLLVDGETAQRGYVLTADSAFLGPLEGMRADLPANVDALGALLAEKRDEAEAQQLREVVEARAAWTEATVAMAERGDLEGARARVATREGMRHMDGIRDLARAIGDREDAHVAALVERVETSRLRVHVAFGALVAIAITLAILLSLALRRELARLAAFAQQIDADERRFRALAESATDLVGIHSRDGRMEYTSPSATRLLGYAPDEITAMPPFALIPEADRARVEEAVRRMLETGVAPEPIRHPLVRRDGQLRTYETRIDPAPDETGVIQRYHTVGRDVTARAIEEEKLTEAATTDRATGLLNAGAFAERGAALLARCEADAEHAMLAFCDLNGLKLINDELGHETGDEVIADVARLLRASARDADLVARVGGDEFVVLGLVRDEAGAAAFAQRVRDRVDAHNEPADRPYRVSLSVGTAVFVPGRDTTLEALRAEADAAMYRVKKRRRGTGLTLSGESIVREPRHPS